MSQQCFSADVCMLMCHKLNTTFFFFYKVVCGRGSVTFQLSLIEHGIWKVTLRVSKGECEFWTGLALRGHVIAYKGYCLALF